MPHRWNSFCKSLKACYTSLEPLDIPLKIIGFFLKAVGLFIGYTVGLYIDLARRAASVLDRLGHKFLSLKHPFTSKVPRSCTHNKARDEHRDSKYQGHESIKIGISPFAGASHTQNTRFKAGSAQKEA
ncbi:hypothetical protein BHE90_008324 [Fusarium euwallaceae]|uniref:Uncharacterized protein n=1 Tax=Fusarium euwallaceae TaxID=1147111 RepID=A0A430LNA1_9HYPO|nr:hypothetical protein BHE90_008324 [Fusarium euwallaceae]